MVAAKFGDVSVVGNEILQEAGEMVALAESHVGAQQILVDYSQVEVVAERMHMHEVSHLVTLLCEEHRELQKDRESRQGCYQAPHTLLQALLTARHGRASAATLAPAPEQDAAEKMCTQCKEQICRPGPKGSSLVAPSTVDATSGVQ